MYQQTRPPRPIAGGRSTQGRPGNMSAGGGGSKNDARKHPAGTFYTCFSMQHKARMYDWLYLLRREATKAYRGVDSFDGVDRERNQALRHV